MGVCLGVMLTGLHPFDGKRLKDIKAATHVPFKCNSLPWFQLSDSATDLLLKMLTVRIGGFLSHVVLLRLFSLT